MLKDYSKSINYNISIEQVKVDLNEKHTLTNNILSSFLHINKKEHVDLINSSKKLLQSLNYNETSNIKELLGQKKYNNYFLNLKDNLSYCQMNINNYYFELLQKRQLLTNKITPIDMLECELEKPIYDHITHKTGRAKIIKGYNFLVAKSNSKKLYKASKNKHLIEIDFKSAEPNLYYSLKFNKSCKDIYSLFNIKKERKKIKIAVISCLYGGKVSSIKRNTGLTESEIKKIIKVFNPSELLNNLNDYYVQHNNIKNIYGRHVYGNTSLVNYWIQSSAADYAFSCFYDLFLKYNIDVKAIIHDAIIFECNDNVYKDINKIKKLSDPITNISIPIDIKVIDSNIY